MSLESIEYDSVLGLAAKKKMKRKRKGEWMFRRDARRIRRVTNLPKTAGYPLPSFSAHFG